ncbi:MULTISPECIES: hypothetical protein [Bifidobacterium]|uniref:hypothetical protein n=1 Tax=Bifidobacterium TaxID=1678 RepID=UPI0015A5944D|nr:MULTISPECIES: hypothetical protein [Bifidobacterium]MBH0362777.1 hypothetical protein [Bifidobacterium longum]MCH4845702.1 hypothetical protein [Bifidobacterium longum]QXT30949.1 hypothetical protein BLS605_08385 [Bifidobacterium longum subsp. suillum]UNL69849.1 hypothetical protein G8B13_08110 [Bifidobacterium longum subsp. longum]
MKRIDVNHGWRFRSIGKDRDTAARQPVTLPHDAMIHESRDPRGPHLAIHRTRT